MSPAQLDCLGESAGEETRLNRYPGQIVVKNLGRDIREDTEVRGSRVTTTIKAGILGNSKPIVVEREFWHAEAFDLNLLSVRRDPGFGQQTFTVTGLSRDVPPSSDFEVPDGYAVVDDRQPATK